MLVSWMCHGCGEMESEAWVSGYDGGMMMIQCAKNDSMCPCMSNVPTDEVSRVFGVLSSIMFMMGDDRR